jgi:hypothetical protein
MSEKVHAVIRYDGPALDEHSMDVSHLAPALLALSDVIKAANQYANSDRAGIKVFVNANLEQKCFELNLELVQTIWEQARQLIADDRVQTAKEIAEWIGIIGSGAAGSYSLFRLIRSLKGKKITSTTIASIKDGRSQVEIRIEGQEDPLITSKTALDLYSNTLIRRKAIEVLSPLKEDGYESLQFHDGQEIFTEFFEDDVPETDGSDLPEVFPQNLFRSEIRAHARIRKAAYEGKSRWTLVYKRAIEAAIDDEEWLRRFQEGVITAPPGSSLEVTLEETYITNDQGEIVGDPSYRVTKVHNVQLPRKQHEMILGNDNPE